jgi:uncharacterized membrane protein YgcG
MRGLLFLSAVSAVVGTSVTLKDCSAGNSFFKIKSLDFTPVAPVPGQNGTLHTLYDVPMTVSAGTTKYSCTLNGLPVFSESYDLCSQTACPITGGTHDDYSTSAVPDTTGKVSCTIDWRDTAGTQLLCIQMVMNLATASARFRGTVTKNFPGWHTQLLVGTNLSENKTCPLVEDYDPLWPAVYVYEGSSSTSGSSGKNGTSSTTQTGGSTSSGGSSSGSSGSGGSSSVAEKRLERLLTTLRGKHVHHIHPKSNRTAQ